VGLSAGGWSVRQGGRFLELYVRPDGQQLNSRDYVAVADTSGCARDAQCLCTLQPSNSPPVDCHSACCDLLDLRTADSGGQRRIRLSASGWQRPGLDQGTVWVQCLRQLSGHCLATNNAAGADADAGGITISTATLVRLSLSSSLSLLILSI